MIHLRIVAPASKADRALGVLEASESVCNIVHLSGAARRPEGDVILADVAHEDASVLLDDLKELGIHHDGSISLSAIDTQISDRAEQVVELARGAPADAVVWEEVEQRTEENVELSGVYLAFMVLAGLLAAVGVYQDSPILIVGAMVVGPEFGPIAGFCVAAVQREPQLARRSATALAVGFPLTIVAVYVATQVFRATGLFTETFDQSGHGLANIIVEPGLLLLLRGRLRRRGRDAEPLDGQVRRPHRRPHLRHHDPRGGQRGPLGRLRGLGEHPRQRGAARDQPRRRHPRGHDGARAAAPALPAPPGAPPARAAARTSPGDGAQTDEPSVDQISIFVLTFSTTAPVNSDVVACPPRSTVLTPPAVVSSTLS